MKITIDTKVLKQEEVSVGLMCFLLSVYLKNPIMAKEDLAVFTEACERGLIKYTRYDMESGPQEIELTRIGGNFIEGVLAKSLTKAEITEKEREKYRNLAKKMQELYPEGIKPGTHEKWKSSFTICGDRLLSLVKRFNLSFSEEDAIQACKNYVNACKSDPTTMRVLMYFIWKNDNGEFKSDFLTYLENLGQNDKTTDKDWTTETR